MAVIIVLGIVVRK